jgi:DnaJ-class molecular chaperone
MRVRRHCQVAWEEERRAERSERARQARLFGERFVYSSREYREEKERAEAHRTRPRIQFCTAGDLSLYDLLKVAPDATVEEIKTSFRSLAMSCHPDKFPDQDAKAKASLQFKKLVAAYQTLRDPQKRKQYDVYGESDK